MSVIMINRARTCAFSGHRAVGKDLKKGDLKEIIEKFTENGYDTFLIGMARGFDLLCYSVLDEIRKEKPIKIVACIPCENQDEKFSLKDKQKYNEAINGVDDKIYIGREYDKRCMHKRNEFMVDNSSALIVYLKRDFGGTYSTIKYAEKNGVPVFNILDYKKSFFACKIT